MTLKSSPARIAAPNHVHMPHSESDFFATAPLAGFVVAAPASAGAAVGCEVATSTAATVVGAVVAATADCVAGGVYAANNSGLFGSTFVPAATIFVSALNVGRFGGRQTLSSQIWY